MHKLCKSGIRSLNCECGFELGQDSCSIVLKHVVVATDSQFWLDHRYQIGCFPMREIVKPAVNARNHQIGAHALRPNIEAHGRRYRPLCKDSWAVSKLQNEAQVVEIARNFGGKRECACELEIAMLYRAVWPRRHDSPRFDAMLSENAAAGLGPGE